VKYLYTIPYRFLDNRFISSEKRENMMGLLWNFYAAVAFSMSYDAKAYGSHCDIYHIALR